MGAQRRKIDENDLPQIQQAVKEYLNMDEQDKDSSESALNLLSGQGSVQIAAKEKIADDGEYNLSGERYRAEVKQISNWPNTELGKVVEILDKLRKPITKHDRKPGPYPYYGATGILDYVEGYIFDEPLILIGEDGAKWESGEQSAFPVKGKIWVNNHAHVLRPKRDQLLDRFLIEILNQMDLTPYITGVTVPKLNQSKLKSIEIPLPPLEVQREIVAEIEGYQKVIDGARTVVENYRPHITIDPGWPIVKIGEYCTVKGGKRLPKGEQLMEYPTSHPYIRVSDFRDQTVKLENLKFISEKTHKQIAKYTISSADVYISIAGTIGLMGTIPENLNGANLTENAAKLSFDTTQFDKKFLSIIGNSDAIQSQIRSLTHAVGVPKLALERIKLLQFPSPPLKTQQALTAEIEAEQSLVSANQVLIERMGEKIRAAIDRVWNEDKIK